MAGCVLVVEDERKIRDLLRRYLEHEGLAVLTTGSGAEALGLLDTARPDLVVLDLGLPDVPGEEVAHHAVSDLGVPVLMLTAKAEVDDRIRGLRQGAADYVTKPFSPREVVLRVTAILARTGSRPAAARSFDGGRLVLDLERRTAAVEGEPVDLTVSEWQLLLALAEAPGRVFGRAELVGRIRSADFEGYLRIIDTHVKNLRRKLDRPTRPGSSIETVLGAGYRFSLAPDDPRS